MTSRDLSWMENRADDALLSDLMLGRRRAVAAGVGPLAGRLFMQLSEDGSAYPLAVRFAIAMMFTGAALALEDEPRSRTPRRLAAETWESLGGLPVDDAFTVFVGDAACFLPFSALRYAEVVFRDLGDGEAEVRCRTMLDAAVADARRGPLREACDAWLRTGQGRLR